MPSTSLLAGKLLPQQCHSCLPVPSLLSFLGGRNKVHLPPLPSLTQTAWTPRVTSQGPQNQSPGGVGAEALYKRFLCLLAGHPLQGAKEQCPGPRKSPDHGWEDDNSVSPDSFWIISSPLSKHLLSKSFFARTE